MSVDYERALLLMSVVHKAAELGPRDGNNIAALATMELRDMDDGAKEVLAADAAERAAEEAERIAATQPRAIAPTSDESSDEPIEDDSDHAQPTGRRM